ncbi:MAG: hypothetical protein JNM39_17390 [Bdellovibrionaceae bacterium]|nr:hypothetical protein [Pseudobdellovibrionaceae bacterium]
MKSLFFLVGLFFSSYVLADENLFGYVRGAEPLPEGSWEIYQIFTQRNDKGRGKYSATDSETEFEYGVTNRFSVMGSFSMMAIDTSGLVIDGYLPKDAKYGLTPSGLGTALKYNFLSPAKDDFGLAAYLGIEYKTLDPHSGQKKDTTSVKLLGIVQKYFLEGELIWSSNFGMESTYAHRKKIDDLPEGFDWPVEPEMEIEVMAGTALSYRFMPKWFVGVESLFETEYETEIGQERWTIFAGPNLHYGSQQWWSTLTYFHQMQGGREQYPDQTEKNLHLVEKTKYEVRWKVGFNF